MIARTPDAVVSACRRVAATVLVALALTVAAAPWAAAQTERPPAGPAAAVPSVSGPDNTLGTSSDADIWRQIKAGEAGSVGLRDPNAGRLVQYEGQIWRELHNGTIPRWGAWGLLGVVVLLALVFAIVGRVRIQEGRAGIDIPRFTAFERAGHWLTAGSFVVLAVTGLNLLYGKSVVMPVIGKEAYATLAWWGKHVHNYVAFAFIAGLVFLFLRWVAHNIPSRHDVVWLAKGGGILVKGVHPPAKKFNAGQKIIFWLTILGGTSVALSGWALLNPFTTHYMADTFEALARIGLDVPAWLGLPEPPYSALMEQQMNQVWHAAMGLFLTAVIIAHIYIGTLGMEGAFEAMGTGHVDLNWAREHHNLWVREMERKGAAPHQDTRPDLPAGEPAE